MELTIKLKYVVLEFKDKELQDEVGGHTLVLQGLPHSLRPILHLYVGVEGRHFAGDSDKDGALGEGPNVLEELV